MAKKRKPWERNWMSSNSTTKQRNKDYVKARIDKTQQNSRCRLCGDKDETINNTISEHNKLVQKKSKTRPDWVGKVIHRELCKKFKSDHTNKWYKHDSESIPENETLKILWDFEIQTDHLISVRRPDFVIVKKTKNKKKQNKTKKHSPPKKPLLNSGIYRFGWPLSKTERKRKEN